MSGAVPKWLAEWLGVDPTAAGEGTVWRLDGSWGWAPGLTLLFILFAVGWVGCWYFRESGEAGRAARCFLAGCRLAAIGLVLFMIAQVVLSLERTGLPYIAVLVDESNSMDIVDRYDDDLKAKLQDHVDAIGLTELTRLNLAKAVLLKREGRFLKGLENRYKVRLYFVAGDARLQSSNPDEWRKQIADLLPTGESSRLGRSLRSVLNDLRGAPPAAIVYLTDGINSEGETLAEAAAYARRKNVPLYTVGLGSDEPVRDIELADLLVDEVVFVDDVVQFEFKVLATGYEGRSVKAVLRERDSPAELAEIAIDLPPAGESRQVRLPYRPTQVGEFEYVISIEPLPEELAVKNNELSRIVSVRKEQIKVLFVQSTPSHEYRYLKHMLERDPTIEVKTVLQEADLDFAESDQSALKAFPTRRDDIFAYDVILFGDVNPDFLNASAIGHLVDFVVEKGGGMVFIAGQAYTPMAYRTSPLADLFPIDPDEAIEPDPDAVAQDGFRPAPTELGLATPHMQLGDSPAETVRIWQELPELYWTLEAPDLKRGARVLAEHPTELGPDGRRLPLIAMQYAGAGKVLFHATDETYRWRYRGQQGRDAYFARYWIQAIRYLSRSKLLGKDRAAELKSDAESYQRGQPVRLRARFFDERLAPIEDDGVSLVIEREGHPNERLTLHRTSANRGVFEGTLQQAPVGTYHAWIAAPALEGRAASVDFAVEAPPGERERIEMDAAELRRAAEMTEGRYYDPLAAADLVGDLPPGRQVPVEDLPPIVLWNKWPLLLAGLSLLVGEWILRKRKGML